jgi:DNA-binding GntR family transcriptional regulator
LYPKVIHQLKPSKPRRLLREEVYRILRERILQGFLPPGTRLVEANLAHRLGTSRTPVREALHRLEQEGLVRPAGRRGVVVVGLDLADIQEIMGLREVLESHAAGLAAVRITEREFGILERALRHAERAIQEGDPHALLQWNTRFHDGIVAASGSRRLRDLINRLSEVILAYRKLTLQVPGLPARSHQEHVAILEALRRRDREVAETLMRAHIRGKTRALLEALQSDKLTLSPAGGSVDTVRAGEGGPT